MAAEWCFPEVDRRYKNREAMQGEFFASGTNVRALVRESIQNSLDAKLPNDIGPVRVRIYVSGEQGALRADIAQAYLGEAWCHFEAEGNGLTEPPCREDTCKFVVLEDFGTIGLNGDISQYHEIPSVRNPFYYFFRAEGQSPKDRSDRGRWGIGKYVFPRASRVRSFFGLTIRSSDMRGYLVGQAILKFHMVAGRHYTPDGWFGVIDGDGLPLPADDPELQKAFCRDFALARTNETGLSVVVPYMDDEITLPDVMESVVREFFVPILSGALHVTTAGPEGEIVLEAGSLERVLEKLPGGRQQSLRTAVELARWGINAGPTDLAEVRRRVIGGSPKWSEVEFSPDKRTDVRSRLERNEPVAIRVFMAIRKSHEEPVESYFDILMKKDLEGLLPRPVFVRDGLIIPNVDCPRLRGMVALVIADHPGFAELLGDAENPAHTEWNSDSSLFKNKYMFGPGILKFVKNSVHELQQLVYSEDEEEDRTLLMDIFSLPAPVGEQRRRRRGPTDLGTDPDAPDIDLPPVPPKKYRVNRIEGGFSITPGNDRDGIPFEMDVQVFYDRRGGRPKYSEADFRLDRAPISLNCKGVKGTKGKNTLSLEVIDKDFHVKVTGFDPKRDLYIKPTVKSKNEVADA